MKTRDLYKEYLRTNVVEMTEWTPSTDMSRVSVSDINYKNGSPQKGDMIARNPKRHGDKWLVAKAYFSVSFQLKDDFESRGCEKNGTREDIGYARIFKSIKKKENK